MLVQLQTKMELLSGEALSKYLLEKYSRNPKGWNFTIAPAAKDNFFDALVSGPEENWQLEDRLDLQTVSHRSWREGRNTTKKVCA